MMRRFRDEDERAPLVAVVAEVFPYLLSIFQGLLAVPSPPIEVAELLKLLCKIFWSTNYVSEGHPLFHADPPCFRVVLAVCFQAVDPWRIGVDCYICHPFLLFFGGQSGEDFPIELGEIRSPNFDSPREPLLVRSIAFLQSLVRNHCCAKRPIKAAL